MIVEQGIIQSATVAELREVWEYANHEGIGFFSFFSFEEYHDIVRRGGITTILDDQRSVAEIIDQIAED